MQKGLHHFKYLMHYNAERLASSRIFYLFLFSLVPEIKAVRKRYGRAGVDWILTEVTCMSFYSIILYITANNNFVHFAYS